MKQVGVGAIPVDVDSAPPPVRAIALRVGRPSMPVWRRWSGGSLWTLIVSSLIATAGCCMPAAAQSPPEPRAIVPDVARQIETNLAGLAGNTAGQTPALAVAVVSDGRVAFVRGFGAARADSRFRIGSITKMFTAVSVLQLAEQGRVDLDAPVATYLPDAPYATRITVRQLLAHRSGLWNYGDAAFADGSVVAPVTPRQILARVATHPLAFAPGTGYAYSNSGYVILGLVVERVAGVPLAAYERAHIFEPAGMNATTFDGAADADVVPGYDSAAGKRAGRFDPSWLYADGDIVSTANDLARFDLALLGGQLVSAPAFARMQTDAIATGSFGERQGLGVQIHDAGGVVLVGHHGGVPGFEAENEIVPRDGVAVVVLSSAFDFATASANRIVFTALYPNLDGEAAGARSPEDAAVTARFRRAVDGLLAGRVDRAQLSPAMNAALTPDLLAQTVLQLHALGTVTNVTYLNRQTVEGRTVYRYRVAFSAGATMTWIFAVDADGKIAGIGSSG